MSARQLLKTKRGRKQKPHVDSVTGNAVPGLYRLKDGKRWRVNATGFRFTEADEQKAIERFRKLTDAGRGQAELDRYSPAADKRLFRWFAQQLATRPQWVAEATGVAWLAYGPTIRPPEPLPSFDELKKFWEENAKCSPLQMKKVRRAFEDFVKVTEIGGLRDFNRSAVLRYEKAVTARGESPKQQFHLVTGIRRVLRFYLRKKAEGEASSAIQNAVNALGSFESSGTKRSLDPKPIEVEHWRRMLAAANDDDRALLLLMLNGAFYIGEVVDLRWRDVKDGCIITHREKTGQCIRVCVLWQETLDALAKLPRRGEAIFFNYQGKPIGVGGAQRRWQRLALKVGLATERMGACKKKVINCDVTASQLRDGAYTAAAAANVSENICRLLVGHSCGIADHYVKRSPRMVKPATDAVYAHYFG